MKYDVKALEAKMKKSTESLEYNLASIRASQANARVLDRVSFEYYGSMTAISSIAEIKASDARTLVITAWDKSVMREIEKAIQKSDLGINPQNDGSCIRLAFPPMNEERRRDLSKQISKLGEDCKVAVRNIRRDANDKIKAMKKDSQMTEDEAKQSDKLIQDLTDKYVKEVDVVTAAKTKEIMEI